MTRQGSESAYDADTHTWVLTDGPDIAASRQPAGNRALERAGLTGEERAYSFLLDGAFDLDPNDSSFAVVARIDEVGAVFPEGTLYRFELKNVEVWSTHTEVLAIRREAFGLE